MSRLLEVSTRLNTMDTIVELTSVFEGIASMRIARIKNQVAQSQKFFSELWGIYSQLRVDDSFSFGRIKSEAIINKQLYVVITSGGGLSGDIDQKLIDTMLKSFDPNKQDIIVVGHHGAVQLLQRNAPFKKYFTLPTKDRDINTEPITREVRRYKDAVVFYETYVSLMVQEVKSIDLFTAVQQAGSEARNETEVINETNYIFEPSTYNVVAHLERSMMQVTLNQVILDSKLAQYASRFRAMSSAKHRAGELQSDLSMLYSRTKRNTQDERLKEVMNGLRKVSTI